jgi:hypothetical protein
MTYDHDQLLHSSSKTPIQSRCVYKINEWICINRYSSCVQGVCLKPLYCGRTMQFRLASWFANQRLVIATNHCLKYLHSGHFVIPHRVTERLTMCIRGYLHHIMDNIV